MIDLFDQSGMQNCDPQSWYFLSDQLLILFMMLLFCLFTSVKRGLICFECLGPPLACRNVKPNSCGQGHEDDYFVLPYRTKHPFKLSNSQKLFTTFLYFQIVLKHIFSFFHKMPRSLKELYKEYMNEKYAN